MSDAIQLEPFDTRMGREWRVLVNREIVYEGDATGAQNVKMALDEYAHTLTAEVERLRAEMVRLTRNRDRLAEYARAALRSWRIKARAVENSAAAWKETCQQRTRERDEAREDTLRLAQAVREERDDARREVWEAREVLRRVEWSGPVAYVSTDRDVTIHRAAGRRLKTPRKETQHSRIPSSACPVCGGVKPLDSISPYDRYVTPVGHTADCALAAALGKEQGNV